MNYDLIKAARKAEKPIDESTYADAIKDQEKVVADLAIDLGTKSGLLKAAHSLTPFDLEEQQKAVGQASMELTHALERLSKLVYWRQKAKEQ